MTQPIQEPSTQRSVSGLAWGESQLARRPGPPPPAVSPPLPWGYRISFGTQSVPDSTITPITFVGSGTGPPRNDVSDTADIEVIDDTGQYGFDLHLSGFWRLRIVVYWDDDPGYGNAIINNNPTEVIDAISPRLLPRGGPISYEMVWPEPARASSPVYPYFVQYSGLSKDIFVAQFSAIYLGSYGGNPDGVT